MGIKGFLPLSPSPSSTPDAVEKDIVLMLDSGVILGTVQPEVLSTFGNTISRPEFWKKVYALLKYAVGSSFPIFVTDKIVRVFLQTGICSGRGCTNRF